MTEHHEKPDSPNTTKALLIGLAPALLVVVLLVVGGLLYTAPAPDSPATATPAVAQAEGSAAAGSTTDAAEITAVMQRYSDGMNAGDAALFKSALCESSQALTADLADQPPLESGRGKLESVSDVQVSGNTATALITATVEDAPDLGSKSTQLNFVNEDGWKLC
ncbi:Rv0361 family membrane protein [Tomitella biformata]|uniref:Rv0361 family membrane protein n=1 Tax=Tomitella biformata TaxID=630403 RepID=UPI00046778BB|nr:hypothetical protein [Tomitella biformata]